MASRTLPLRRPVKRRETLPRAVLGPPRRMATPWAAPRRFAPLRDGPAPAGLPRLQGIVFDVDGTLCCPQTYMFAEMRAALGIPPSTDILAHIDSLPPHEQPAAAEAVRAVERRAVPLQVPQPGLAALMAYLDARALPKAICTRNFDLPVRALLDKFLAASPFHPVVTRAFRPPKPDPAGILHIAAAWGLPDASGLIMVGDSVDDMTAGRRAGAATVLLLSDANGHLADHEHTDLAIRRLDDLVAVLDRGFEARQPVN